MVPDWRIFFTSSTASAVSVWFRPGHGFIQHEQLGFGGKGFGHLQPLFVGDGQAAGEQVLFRGQAAEIQDLQGFLPGLAGRIGAVKGAHHDVIQNGQILENPHNLKSPGDTPQADLVRRQTGDIFSFELDAAAAGRVKTGDAVEEGSFPRAIGTDETDDFSFVELKVDMVVGHEAAKSLGELLYLQKGHQVRLLFLETLGDADHSKGLIDGDDHDEETINDQVGSLAPSPELDPGKFRDRDEDERSDHRPPDGPHSAQGGHQANE